MYLNMGIQHLYVFMYKCILIFTLGFLHVHLHVLLLDPRCIHGSFDIKIFHQNENQNISHMRKSTASYAVRARSLVEVTSV